MGMMATWMMLLVMLTQGGGGDLLDQVSTDAYWQAKSVTVTPQVMREMAAADKKADVSREIAQLSSADAAQRVTAMKGIIAAGPGALGQLEELAASADPKLSKLAANLSQQIKKRANDEAIRQLMAIRTLGELGDKESLPLLNGLLGSKEAFVADYARTAIARIEGKPLVRLMPQPADREADLAVLPGKCGLVAQVSLTAREGPLPARKQDLPTAPPKMGAVERQMVSLAEMVGNVRLASLTLGFGEDVVGVGEEIGPATKGFFALVARGQYDRATVANLLSREGATTSVIGTTIVYSPGAPVRVILTEDGRVILLFAAKPEQLPISEVVAALEGGPSALRNNQAMSQLLGTVDHNLPLWAVARMTDGYKALPLPPTMPVPFDSLCLTGSRSGGGLKLRLQGAGTDAGMVEAAAQAYQDLLSKAAADMQQPAERMPIARVIRDFLLGITVQAKDKEMAMEGDLRMDELSPATLMGDYFGVRTQRQ